MMGGQMMGGQSYDDPMRDVHLMVFLKMDAKMDDHLMVDRYCVDALPLISPIFTS
jgi:hypothetical protein